MAFRKQTTLTLVLAGLGALALGAALFGGGGLLSNEDGPPEAVGISHPVDVTHGPLVGGVRENGAKLWVRTEVSAEVSFIYGRTVSLAKGKKTRSRKTDWEDDFTVTMEVTGLEANTLYYYRPVLDGVIWDGEPCPSFRTAPPAGSATDFSFVYLTDFQNPSRAGQPGTFRAASLESPAFTILGGDLDHRNPGLAKGDTLTDDMELLESIRQMRRDNFDRTKERRRDLVDLILRRGGIAHFWDDHDFCCNDSDGSFAGKWASLQVYNEYFPGYERPEPEDGIYQTWTWGSVQFFLLDGRFNRTNSDVPDGPGKTMLGEKQKAWLKTELKNSSAMWKILLSGSVFNPTVKCGADNWCDFGREARELTSFIRGEGIANVVILSGDIHAGGITDGTNSVFNTFWEMAVPGADTERPGCDTTTYQGPNNFGEWTHGTWGEGFRSRRRAKLCFGYGLVEVRTNPPRLVLSVKNELGKTMIKATVKPE